jgi:hypothetical protein
LNRLSNPHGLEMKTEATKTDELKKLTIGRLTIYNLLTIELIG